VKKSADEKLDVLHGKILSDKRQGLPIYAAHHVPCLKRLSVFLREFGWLEMRNSLRESRYFEPARKFFLAASCTSK
jgi:hypothetical protein